MEDLVVAVPWAETAPERLAALDWVSYQWASIGHLGLTRGACDSEHWCKARAVADAVEGQPGDVLVVSDADVWCPGVMEAVDRVRAGAPWAIPHRKVYRLSRQSTERVLSGEAPNESLELEPFRDNMPGFAYVGVAGGGVVVLRRDVYEDCPLDPRFVGWGQEDESWALALSCLYGPPVRLAHPLWHLWHPPQSRKNRGVGSDEGMALYKRYARAKRRPEQMRALIEEAQWATTSK